MPKSMMLIAAILTAILIAPLRADEPPAEAKPKVAVFPLGGSADADTRTKVGFSMRMKLDRDGTYEPIDGPAMLDLAGELKDPIAFDTSAETLKPLAAESDAVVLIWGEMNAEPGGAGLGKLRVKILDLRDGDAKPKEIERDIVQPTDMRFVVEDVLKNIAGVKDFQHPNEEEVHHDPASDAAFARNPNLLVNGDFAIEGHWNALYMSQKYPPPMSDSLPGEDRVVIYHLPAAGTEQAHNVLAMKLSVGGAENNGLACLSDAMEIGPGIKFRIHFRYKSDGPTLHVFVKGYTLATDLAGNKALREVYRRQVSPTGPTDGKWRIIESDFNPQNITFPVQYLKVDLYAYLAPGTVLFDDVQVKEIGRQADKDQMRDAAIGKPTTAPDKKQ
jgi:hypothetical protein